MNHFSYEVMGKEKVKGFRDEGLRNQEVHRSNTRKMNFLGRLPKLILVISMILGVLVLIIR
jgi:hypothetical protein